MQRLHIYRKENSNNIFIKYTECCGKQKRIELTVKDGKIELSDMLLLLNFLKSLNVDFYRTMLDIDKLK